MNDNELLDRIVANPKIMVGKPVIRGTRLTVELIFERLAHGAVAQTLIKEYPGLTENDIYACYLFASRSIGSTTFMPTPAQVGA